MPYDNKIYRVADPVPPGAARPPIYGDGASIETPSKFGECEYYFVTLPGATPGSPPKTQHMKKCPPDWTPTPAPASPPVPSMGSGTTTTTTTARPRPPSTGGGKGKSEKCTMTCFDYDIDPMRPERGTARQCVCVTGRTG